MPKPIDWTPDMDARLSAMRDAQTIWADIAIELGLSRSTVIQRGAALGYIGRPVAAPLAAPAPAPSASRGGRPLPAGHPISWGILTAGTCLADISCG